MKGSIPACLKEMVINKFGEEAWEKSLENAGLSGYVIFVPMEDVPDEDVLKLVNSVCKVLNIPLTQLADAFGDYWVNKYGKEVYSMYYKGNSAKEFLLNMDDVHQMVTRRIPNAHPPRFDYEWKDDNTLIMTYKSKRKLIDFVVGLVKGVGKYYQENLRVTKLGEDRVQVEFLG